MMLTSHRKLPALLAWGDGNGRGPNKYSVWFNVTYIVVTVGLGIVAVFCLGGPCSRAKHTADNAYVESITPRNYVRNWLATSIISTIAKGILSGVWLHSPDDYELQAT